MARIAARPRRSTRCCRSRRGSWSTSPARAGARSSRLVRRAARPARRAARGQHHRDTVATSSAKCARYSEMAPSRISDRVICRSCRDSPSIKRGTYLRSQLPRVALRLPARPLPLVEAVGLGARVAAVEFEMCGARARAPSPSRRPAAPSRVHGSAIPDRPRGPRPSTGSRSARSRGRCRPSRARSAGPRPRRRRSCCARSPASSRSRPAPKSGPSPGGTDPGGANSHS